MGTWYFGLNWQHPLEYKKDGEMKSAKVTANCVKRGTMMELKTQNG